MGCAGCSVADNGSPKGCKSNGGCSSGGCNRLNTYDWLVIEGIEDTQEFQYVEVSFKQGARKNFYRVERPGITTTGDFVAVESKVGYDLGRITLSGELVRLQMKKKKVRPDSVKQHVLRIANDRDLERLQEVRSKEHDALVKSRAIARTLDMDMKVCDVEYQGDGRKITFYYTAEGRVDFRELIRHYARDFRAKIEMRQIGARQESARLGGLGSCGRELCCSTWLTNFKSVSTAAARYQNLAINQAKLSGQCGRLKCCLNYELDTYMEAVARFPKKADKLRTEAGTAYLIKTDIFKELMHYSLDIKGERNKFYTLRIEDVEKILTLNRRGEKPKDLTGYQVEVPTSEEENVSFGDIHDVVDLPPMEKSSRRRKKRRKKNRKSGSHSSNQPANGNTKSTQDGKGAGKKAGNDSDNVKSDNSKEGGTGNKRRRGRGRNRNQRRKKKSNPPKQE